MADRIATGIQGLDEVLLGGLQAGHAYLLEGAAGTGKTTLGLQFLIEGVRRGESALYVTLSETEDDLRASASSHGWNLDGIAIEEVNRPEEILDPEQQYSVFHPSEVELSENAQSIVDRIESLRPTRIVLDALSELRLLAQDPLRYRREVLRLREHFRRRGCTALLIEEKFPEPGSFDLRSLAHGILSLEKITGDYGGTRRRLLIHKLRGSDFKSGNHDFAIHTGGVVLFPRLVAAEHQREWQPESVSSGLQALDDLLGGGVPRRSSTLVMGPAGSGKTSIVMQYMLAAAARGESSAIYMFDESKEAFLTRWCRETDLQIYIEKGLVHLQSVDPSQMSAGEFAHTIRRQVEKDNLRLIAIDSLSGYLAGMSDEKFLNLHLHELLSYLAHSGVLTLVVMTEHGLIGSDIMAPAALSYLADTVLLLRYFEARGSLHQAISVVKKRAGKHERTIREFSVTGNGVWLGPPLTDFHGILSGMPVFEGDSAALARLDSDSQRRDR